MKQKITNPLGEKLDYTFAPAEGEKKHADWLVILAHGVTGNKDRPVITTSAEALNAAGFDTLRFSFSGNGDSEGDFRKATINKECHDLRAVIDSASERYEKICLLGHSMGGAVNVLVAAQDPRATVLISLAGMVNTKKFAENEFGEVTPDKGNMWDDSDCPLSQNFMDDLCQKIGSVLPHAEEISVPWLLLHGSEDDVVKPADSAAILAFDKDNIEITLIDGAGHTFDQPEHLKAATQGLADWLSQLT